MRDLLKEFEEYLPRWSNEKHQPIPTRAHMDRWYIAWNDFVKEELIKHYDDFVNEYKSLQLKTDDDYIIQQIEPIEEDPTPEPVPLSPWELVQQKMKNME